MTRYSKLERNWAADVLLSLVSDTQTRLKHGAELRQQMIDAIEKGETPEGYRPPWVRQSANRVLVLLNQIAVEFNDRYGTDQASTNDLLDILSTSAHLLQKMETTPKPPESLA